MLTAPRELILAGDARAPGDEILRVGDPALRLGPAGRRRTLRRVWLDTFDWRLFRAGLTLELIAGGPRENRQPEQDGRSPRSRHATAELVLTGRDGAPIASQAGQPIPLPCPAEALPAGPLREHLATVAGVRALLPVARVTSVRTPYRCLDADDKTVAMVTVDRMTVTGPRGAAPARTGAPAPARTPAPARAPARISVTPLRGYQAEADRVAVALTRVPGIEPAVTSAFESALTAAGRRAGDYSGKIDVRLDPGMPAAHALAAILSSLLDTAEANVPGTLRDIDTEFLHDLRVAVRRTRSVLKSAGAPLPDGLAATYLPEFKWLGDLTTPTRDLDVYLLGYPAMARRLVAGTAEDLQPFREYLERHRAQACRQLARGLRSARFSALTRSWRHDLDRVAAAPARRPRAGAFAAGRIARAHRRVLRLGGAIGPASPPQDLHELRKRCKELRYLLEVFASLHEPAGQWRAVGELKSLQDCLGEFQDTEVQRTELRGFAEQMAEQRSAPAATLLAMGEIAGALAARQRAARGEFAGRFAEFASPHGQARIRALTEAAG